jgi:LysR family transcriptional activator of glutamate synthase operon
MTDRRLKIFCTAAECRSFSAAAELIGISQPAVSKSIASIEQELGCALFLRVGKDTILTPKGEELLIIAKEILDAYVKIDALKF